MKKFIALWLPVFVFFACGEKIVAPDVSAVEMEVPVDRFDHSFFSIDTSRLVADLSQTQAKHPIFYTEFMEGIMGIPTNDRSTLALNNLLFFYRGYRPLYDTLMSTYKQVDDIQKSLKQGLQFVRHYFPKYPANQKLIFFVGPFDAPGVIITEEGIAVGLQLYAGKNFPFYQSQQGISLFPNYISRRFERDYIVANCLQGVIKELCPNTSGSLIDQIVRRGREAWLLERFLPYTADSLRMGFTKDQLRWCQANESLIWSYFLKNVDLHTTEKDIIQTFLGEGPFTAGLDQENSPGNLGTWVGRQIVRAYVRKNPTISPAALIQLEPAKILEGAAYKPR
ncbi:MAG: hypothetical protein FJX92_04995 [Bacteroidetes bacterium]|nr:hypothetical protein [Bacteroidota bacterium]